MMYLASLVEETKDKVDGYNFIHTKTQLDQIVADNLKSNKIILRPDFINEFFTPTGITEYVRNAKIINKNLVIEMDTDLDNNSTDVMIKKIGKCRNLDEFVMLLHAHKKEFLDAVNFLIDKYTNDKDMVLDYSNQISRLQSMVETLKSQVEEQQFTIREETENKLSYQSKFHALISRINYQYNAGVDKNKIFEVTNNNYDKILYIKEITRVQYVDTLIYYLKEIFKTLYSMPTRILVIESYYASGKIAQYPDLTPHHNVVERDILKGDILMLGIQPNMIESILKNASNTNILIVLDRAGYSTPHIYGDNVEMLYTVSDLKDLPEGIPYGRVISYSESTQYIKYLKDFDSMDASAKISAYSSMPIVKNIVNLIEHK